MNIECISWIKNSSNEYSVKMRKLHLRKMGESKSFCNQAPPDGVDIGGNSVHHHGRCKNCLKIAQQRDIEIPSFFMEAR